MTMSHHLTDKYWDSLGPNGPFLCKLFHSQFQQLTQLQMANNALKVHALEAHGDVTDAATKVMSAVAEAILMNMPSGSQSSRSAKAAKPESFNGSQDKAKQFIQSVCITVTI